MINKDSLQARINNLALKKGVPSNVILQSFFFDAFLKRLAKSEYHNNFVFKGGFLLSSSLGIDFRSTMDIDFLLRNLLMEKENIIKTVENIIKIDIDDGINFEFKKIKEIRPEDEYGGFNISLLGHLENIKVAVNIDIATGDPITPEPIQYKYKCVLDEEALTFSSYNFETILAEKLQTVLKRGVFNSRSKDFYDLYIIYKLRFDEMNINVLKEAFKRTCEYRKSIFTLEESEEIINEIKEDTSMQLRWNSYAKKNNFAKDILFSNVIDSIRALINIIINSI